jgi:hypothetical protein
MVVTDGNVGGIGGGGGLVTVLVAVGEIAIETDDPSSGMDVVIFITEKLVSSASTVGEKGNKPNGGEDVLIILL